MSSGNCCGDKHAYRWVGTFPCWLNGEIIHRFARAVDAFWQAQYNAVLRLLDLQFNALNAPLEIVSFIAWERGIETVECECEHLYRLRVHHAYKNALDAGTPAGFKRIFERLEIPVVDIKERQDIDNWDIVDLEIDAEAFMKHGCAINTLFHQYGRTCRYIVVNLSLGQYQTHAENIGAVIESEYYNTSITINGASGTQLGIQFALSDLDNATQLLQQASK